MAPSGAISRTDFGMRVAQNQLTNKSGLALRMRETTCSRVSSGFTLTRAPKARTRRRVPMAPARQSDASTMSCRSRKSRRAASGRPRKAIFSGGHAAVVLGFVGDNGGDRWGVLVPELLQQRGAGCVLNERPELCA